MEGKKLSSVRERFKNKISNRIPETYNIEVLLSRGKGVRLTDEYIHLEFYSKELNKYYTRSYSLIEKRGLIEALMVFEAFGCNADNYKIVLNILSEYPIPITININDKDRIRMIRKLSGTSIDMLEKATILSRIDTLDHKERIHIMNNYSLNRIRSDYQ